MLELMSLWSSFLRSSALTLGHLFSYILLGGKKNRALDLGRRSCTAWNKISWSILGSLLFHNEGTIWCPSHGCMVVDIRQVMPSPVPGIQQVHNYYQSLRPSALPIPPLFWLTVSLGKSPVGFPARRIGPTFCYLFKIINTNKTEIHY